ncbi:hypothetical protein [Burkholderia guangdongensis]|uniref:hypothetical protein n=1 Tax=Burkholderia guangdongensis TaxID=1792500 RepID=UPI0015C7D47D|nr:hypothetical protein [Burkholderia guangdongensis]
MTERQNDIADLAKDLLGAIVRGTLAAGASVDPDRSAELAVRCATALVDRLAAEGE